MSVRRLERCEAKEQTPETGEYVVYNETTGDMHIVAPLEALRVKYHIMTHVVDRSSINSALLQFCVADGFLFAVVWGWFHGFHSSSTNTMKKACKGRPWQCVLGYPIVPNLNYFPYKSGQASTDTRAMLDAYLSTHTWRSLGFQRIKRSFARFMDLP